MIGNSRLARSRAARRSSFSDPRNDSPLPTYFVLLEWAGDELLNIRDFRYARYVVEGAEFATLV
jgi:hypothetical protein